MPICPAVCIEAAYATFNLSCSPNDLVSVVATGPCAMPDASLSYYTGTASQWFVAVGSTVPGDCHVELAFAPGFVYAADVSFSWQSPDDPSCGCPSYIGPNAGSFQVDNPRWTCVDAG
jgi:hypothetical protein